MVCNMFNCLIRKRSTSQPKSILDKRPAASIFFWLNCRKKKFTLTKDTCTVYVSCLIKQIKKKKMALRYILLVLLLVTIRGGCNWGGGRRARFSSLLQSSCEEKVNDTQTTTFEEWFEINGFIFSCTGDQRGSELTDFFFKSCSVLLASSFCFAISFSRAALSSARAFSWASSLLFSFLSSMLLSLSLLKPSSSSCRITGTQHQSHLCFLLLYIW